MQTNWIDRTSSLLKLVSGIIAIAALIIGAILYPIKAKVGEIEEDVVEIKKECKNTYDIRTDIEWLKKSHDELKDELNNFKDDMKEELKDFRKDMVNILRERNK